MLKNLTPYIQIWARDQSCVDALLTLDGVLFGGGPLDKNVGDALTARGVKLYTSYGWYVLTLQLNYELSLRFYALYSTECGSFNKLFPSLLICLSLAIAIY